MEQPQETPTSRSERLHKVLAQAGIGSRRACERLMQEGRVAVDGEVVTRLGTTVDPQRQRITVDRRPLPRAAAPVYLVLNKPPGYVTTAHDPQGRPTVYRLLPPGEGRVYPVGRLDLDSEGLLLFTNDGELAARLTHPRYGVEREYLAWVRGHPPEDTLEQLRAGIVLDGARCVPKEVTRLGGRPVPGVTLLRIVLQEGRKREVRRLCEAVGHPVQRLVRVRYGPVPLGALPPGRWRRLSPTEVEALRRGVGLSPQPP
ncbi:MAG: rRNA pseudouridine synthase [Chloroflexi bacterium]|nr:rRNA pseudouridine synthase [Chloroflexota bacterium]